MNIVHRPSPNHNARPCPVDTVVLHATASADAKQDLAWLCSAESKASAHVVIDRDGTVYDVVPVELRAWHAGVSRFDGRDDVNDFSIGIEFANKNDGREPYTDAQYRAGAALVASWMKLFPAITPQRITTHAAIALPPGRKSDPAGFDLPRFRAAVAAALQTTTEAA